jgi:hypothetical protein
MKLTVIAALSFLACASVFAYAQDADDDTNIVILKAAHEAGKKAAQDLLAHDLKGLKDVVMMGLAGDDSGVIASVVETELSKVGLSFGGFDESDREASGNLRAWLFKYGDPTKFPDDIDERANQILLQLARNPKISGLVYGQFLQGSATEGKATLSILIKILDLRPDREGNAMKIVWQRDVIEEYKVPEPVPPLPDKEKNLVWHAADIACGKAVDAMRAQAAGLPAGMRVIVLKMNDDPHGLGTEALKVRMGGNPNFIVVDRTDEAFNSILQEIRFDAEFQDLSSFSIEPRTLKKLVDLKIADAILISKRISSEVSSEKEHARFAVSLRLLKLNGEQALTASAEEFYRPRAAIMYLSVAGAAFAIALLMFFFTSGVERLRRKRKEQPQVEEPIDTVNPLLAQDKRLRDQMVGVMAEARNILKKAQNTAQANGKTDEAQWVKKSVDGLDALARKVETAAYGDAALFRAGRISDQELLILEEFERKMKAMVPSVKVEAEAAEKAVAKGDFIIMLDRLHDLDNCVMDLSNRFSERDHYLREAR